MRRSARGDTIVEVMIAVAIFGAVVVAALSIMSSGVATTQRSLENILVRQQMDAQAATLRFLRNSYVSSTTATMSAPAVEWKRLVDSDRIKTSVTTFGDQLQAPNTSFILDPKSATYTSYSSNTFVKATTYSMVTYDALGKIIAQGIWVEAVRKDASTNYIDFHIRACWYSAGSVKPATLGTIVRLNI